MTSNDVTFFCQQWQGGILALHNSLERDDFRSVSACNSWQKAHEQIVKAQNNPRYQALSQEFAMLWSSFKHLPSFIDNLSVQVSPRTIDTSAVWGILGLIANLCQEEGDNASRVPGMLHCLCLKIEILNRYRENNPESLTQIREPSFLIALTLLFFLSRIIKFMRSDQWFQSSKGPSKQEWEPLEQQYLSTIGEIDGSISLLERAKPTTLSQPKLDPPPPTPPVEVAKLPCIIRPPFRVPRFFNRTEIMARMESFFGDKDSATSFRSLALHGLGGVGKSSVALRYAEKRLENRELDAIFWVPSEKAVTLRQAFTDIALRLKLPNVQPLDHEENQAIVLNWLENTGCRWLLIYDNVESLDLLLNYWPSTGRGQVIVTSRSNKYAFELAEGGIEVTSWDAETGSQFLLHLLSTDIGQEIAAADIRSANDLSERLAGHALAISQVAGLIHRRSWSISEFVDVYKQQPQKMHGISGNSSINALWNISFTSLDSNSREILGVLAFLAPEAIPQSLFETDEDLFPESLKFCGDSSTFWDAIDDLLSRALIKRDKATKSFSLHRLVQTSFKYFLSPEQRQKSFQNAAILVHLIYPKLDGVSQLYQMWDRCRDLLPHVLALKDQFREEKRTLHFFSAPWRFCDLSNLCERYLLETNLYKELDDLLEVDQMALDTVPIEEQTNDMPSSITSYKGQLYVRTGRAAEGVKILKQSYEIRAGAVPEDVRETAWALENAGNGIATINELEDSIDWQQRAIATWLSWADKKGSEKGVYPAVLKKSYGMVLVWAKRYKDARAILEEGIEQIETTKPYNWAMAAYTHFALGTLDRHERKYDTSELHFVQAQNMWTQGDQLRNDPFNAACIYRMGCISLDQGNVEISIKHFRDAMILTDRRKTHLRAEHARCLFKLSEAYSQEPRYESESIDLRAEAERLIREVDPTIVDCGSENAYDTKINIQWR